VLSFQRYGQFSFRYTDLVVRMNIDFINVYLPVNLNTGYLDAMREPIGRNTPTAPAPYLFQLLGMS
jgi:hypothetical protein